MFGEKTGNVQGTVRKPGHKMRNWNAFSKLHRILHGGCRSPFIAITKYVTHSLKEEMFILANSDHGHLALRQKHGGMAWKRKAAHFMVTKKQR